jgi:hypothetical protein
VQLKSFSTLTTPIDKNEGNTYLNSNFSINRRWLIFQFFFSARPSAKKTVRSTFLSLFTLLLLCLYTWYGRITFFIFNRRLQQMTNNQAFTPGNQQQILSLSYLSFQKIIISTYVLYHPLISLQICSCFTFFSSNYS